MKTVVTRSRFHAHLYVMGDPAEMQDIVKLHRKHYRKANHHCWAYRIASQGGIVSDFRNDGEVGQPGKVLLELLVKYDAEGHGLVVSRIFGGVKLGVGGVSRAFRAAGDEALRSWKEQGSVQKYQRMHNVN